ERGRTAGPPGAALRVGSGPCPAGVRGTTAPRDGPPLPRRWMMYGARVARHARLRGQMRRGLRPGAAGVALVALLVLAACAPAPSAGRPADAASATGASAAAGAPAAPQARERLRVV